MNRFKCPACGGNQYTAIEACMDDWRKRKQKEIRINLPEEVWNSIETVTLTRLFQEELVVGKQEESEVEHNG